MPYLPGSLDGPQYYSYETGPVHVIVVNTFGGLSVYCPLYKRADVILATRSCDLHLSSV